MDDIRYGKLKESARERCKTKVSAAKEECRKAIEAIEHVRRLEKLDDLAVVAAGVGVTTKPRTRKSGLMAAVRSAIQEMVGQITSEAIVVHLEKSGHEVIRASVAGALRRMAEDGTIRTVVAPAGRRAGTYEKTTEYNNNRGDVRIAAV